MLFLGSADRGELHRLHLHSRSFHSCGRGSEPNLTSLVVRQRQSSLFLKKKNFCVFMCWLCWVFVAVHRLSLVAASEGYSPLQRAAFLLQWFCLLQSLGSRVFALRHVDSSGTRDQTCVLCAGRWILNHWTTSEVPNLRSFE